MSSFLNFSYPSGAISRAVYHSCPLPVTLLHKMHSLVHSCYSNIAQPRQRGEGRAPIRGPRDAAQGEVRAASAGSPELAGRAELCSCSGTNAIGAVPALAIKAAKSPCLCLVGRVS